MLCWFLRYSTVNQLYVYICLFFFGFPSHLDHHRTLIRVPCVIQQALISHLFYSRVLKNSLWLLCGAGVLRVQGAWEGIKTGCTSALSAELRSNAGTSVRPLPTYPSQVQCCTPLLDMVTILCEHVHLLHQTELSKSRAVFY